MQTNLYSWWCMGFWWCQSCVDYNLQIILIKVLKIILTITDKFEQNMNSLTWWWCWWWWWYIFSSTSNYLQDLNQSRICTMIIITKKWPHSYFSQVIKNSECIRKLLALAQKVSDLGGTKSIANLLIRIKDISWRNIAIM